ncbi:hypothetical protein CSUB01_01488 [Colletotrichum sublineola]|uniref:Uncharacterized protein n=1 Tax=Colletotrichum sublineola TaxID=1173701 RepID=A0A066XDP1_COLSU|nr:hypothetical protein CSUB01_01488 [Colletotrichum sublineola]
MEPENKSSVSIIKTEEYTATVTVHATPVKGDDSDGTELQAELPQYHTAPPWKLMWDDLLLFIRKFRLVPLIVLPLWYPRRRGADYPNLDTEWIPSFMASTTIINIVERIQGVFQQFVDPMYPSGEMDELYPSVGNLICLTAHTVLIGTQLAFLMSLPLLAFFPLQIFLPYFIGFILINYMACVPLNAGCKGGVLKSRPFRGTEKEHDDELWLFVNGVSVGTHWLQGNLDRLSRTFHREIVGCHNETAGIVFDIIQCLIERCFYYGTSDTRACYAIIAAALADHKKKRVILILHSQGGLEGSLILDWLLSHSSRENLKKLEIYTFGNAANHLNNPEMEKGVRAVNRIEHFANSGDFVESWGVTYFVDKMMGLPRGDYEFFGRVLKDRSHTPKRQYSFQGTRFLLKDKWGHLLNQHYLDRILPLNHTLTAVEEVDSHDGLKHRKYLDEKRTMGRLLSHEDHLKIRNESRLWQYINGRVPDDDPRTNGIH